jgi:glycosyltransferase involved in cell wall biosynthesis
MDINIIGPLCFTGYGVVVNNIVKALDELGHNVALFPIGGIAAHPKDHTIFQKCLDNGQFYNKNAPCVRIYHQFSLAEFVGKGEHIGFPIFELDKFTDIEWHHMSSCDKLFVCSDWAKQIVLQGTDTQNTEVVPLGVDSTIFYPPEKNAIVEKPPEGSPYVFFNAGKWEVRKGHDVLIEAFNKAFTKEDNVELWMLPHNPFLPPEGLQQWVNMYKNSPLGDKITILDHCETQQHVAGIMRQTDCGVFPSKAEGWNLEALEMMGCGKPIIITDYSAHTEFCTEENSKLIKIDELISAYDGIWFHNQGNWANFGQSQMDQLVEHMRYMYKNNIRTNDGGLKTAKQFSWKNSAETLINNLSP